MTRSLTPAVVVSLLCACAVSEPGPSPDYAPEAGETGDDGIDDPPGGGVDAAFNPEGGDSPCLGVDFLFVVDDSPSMLDNQAELAASVPGFVYGIAEHLQTPLGSHVAVTTTNAYPFNDASCREIGAFVTRTGGDGSSQGQCGPYTGGSYMTDADDLGSAFPCAIMVGGEGAAEERPVDAIRTALSPALLGDGGCNEDFLRPDALLVVVLITDEEDDTTPAVNPFNPGQTGSVGDPPQWFSDLVALKGGVEQNVVLLSLVGQPDSNCPAEAAPRLISWTEMFTNGFVGDVCAPHYVDYFAEAVEVVVGACFDFVPEG